jgi:hypothetical protein
MNLRALERFKCFTQLLALIGSNIPNLTIVSQAKYRFDGKVQFARTRTHGVHAHEVPHEFVQRSTFYSMNVEIMISMR